MTYESLNLDNEKKNWFIDWLKKEAEILDGKYESTDNLVFETPDGDVIAAKDVVGYLLATLTNETVNIK
jgi:Uri superfamily endonuclease